MYHPITFTKFLLRCRTLLCTYVMVARTNTGKSVLIALPRINFHSDVYKQNASEPALFVAANDTGLEYDFRFYTSHHWLPKDWEIRGWWIDIKDDYWRAPALLSNTLYPAGIYKLTTINALEAVAEYAKIPAIKELRLL